jgi:hypothetical protein
MIETETPPFHFPFFLSQYAYEASSGLREAVQLMPVRFMPLKGNVRAWSPDACRVGITHVRWG